MTFTKILLFSVCVGLALGGVSMWATWQHDLLCNVHCDGDIRWGYWLVIGGSWFVAGVVAAFSASLFSTYLWRSLRRSGGNLR